jgi:signal peptidase II
MIALIGADQAVKYWAATELKPVHTMDFISVGGKKLVDLTYLENRGAIFGSMQDQRWFLIGFTSLVLIIGFVVLFKYMKRSKVLSLAITLFLAGGIGNLIDRVRLSYVVDMFEFKFMNFAIFNVADICVTLAFVLLVIYALFIDPKIEKAKKIQPDSSNKGGRK